MADKFKIGDRAMTPNGKGTVDNKEMAEFDKCNNKIRYTGRYGVELDKSPFAFKVAYYYTKELKIIK